MKRALLVAFVCGAIVIAAASFARGEDPAPAEPEFCRVIYIDGVAHPADPECSTTLTK